MSAAGLLEEEVDADLLVSKLHARGSASEHLNLSYLGIIDQVLARVAAVMRQSSAFTSIKQIWLGSNQLSSLGDMQLPSCLKGIWLFSNRFDSHAALDVLQRLSRYCPEIQFVHMVSTTIVSAAPQRMTSWSRKITPSLLRIWLIFLPAEATPTCPRSWYPPAAAIA